MGNLSKQKRDILLNHLESIKQLCLNNNESLIAINEIELQLADKKYGLIWEEHEEQVDIEMKTKIPVFVEDKEREIISDSSLPFNFIMEGDNLHSLKLLEKTHKGSIDVIYIDPPYNTGSKDWKYDNDYVDKENSYRHSKWLSMMNNRLTVAKNLLTNEGVLICAIDENEQATLKLLLEDIFGQSYAIDCITIIHNPRGVQGKNFSYVHEYAFFVYKRNLQVIGYTDIEPEEIDWSNFRNWGSESERTDAKNCFYSVDVKDGEIIGYGEVLDDEIHPKQTEIDKDRVHHIYPIDVEGVERKWRYARQSVKDISKYLRAKDTTGRYEIEIGKDFAPFKTVWTNKKYDANEYGTQLIGSMVPDNDFDFPKSLYNVYDCIYAVIKNKPNATVLDFFAGSGTTGHAVMKMNENLGGNRKFILCTNNAIGIKKEKEFSKQFGEIESNLDVWEEWQDKYGIARSITYKRIDSAIKGYVHNKNQKTTLFEKEIKVGDLKKTNKLLEKLSAIKEKESINYDEIKTIVENGVLILQGIIKKGQEIKGIPSNLKYYKTDFIDKYKEDVDDYNVDDYLLDYIVEMVQLENHISIDNQQYQIVLTDEDADNLEIEEEKLSLCKRIYISDAVLLTKKQELLFNEKGIELFQIPQYYFKSVMMGV